MTKKGGGAWTVCRFKRGPGKKEWGGVFEERGGGGQYPDANYDQMEKTVYIYTMNIKYCEYMV